eukprot:scaffold106520_cov66-Phaeocystis_antarctica.AAC.2
MRRASPCLKPNCLVCRINDADIDDFVSVVWFRLGHDNVMLASMGVMFGWGGASKTEHRLV